MVGHAERPVDDRHGVVVFERNVQPARIGCVPHGCSRMSTDRDRAAHLSRVGVDERDSSASSIDGGNPAEVGAQRDGCNVLPYAHLVKHLLGVNVDVRKGAGVAVCGPHATSQPIEDDGARRFVAPIRLRYHLRRGRLEQGGARVRHDAGASVACERALPATTRTGQRGDQYERRQCQQRHRTGRPHARAVVSQCMTMPRSGR